MFVPTYVCICIFVRMYIYMCVCMYICIYTHIHACTHRYTHTYIHAYIHIYMHTATHTCIHTFIHAPLLCLSVCLSHLWSAGATKTKFGLTYLVHLQYTITLSTILNILRQSRGKIQTMGRVNLRICFCSLIALIYLVI